MIWKRAYPDKEHRLSCIGRNVPAPEGSLNPKPSPKLGGSFYFPKVGILGAGKEKTDPDIDETNSGPISLTNTWG